MPKITIDESGCRACNLCVEICPTDVLEMDKGGDVAKVSRVDDCIGCTSCMYLCPSRCLEVTEYATQRPFYQIEENTELISKFLQKKPAILALSEADYKEALWDLSTRLLALTNTTAETVGRGQRALGRQSGMLAAEHLPEMYESTTPEELLEKLKVRFQHSFGFEPKVISGKDSMSFKFHRCGVLPIVRRAGEKEGESTLCNIFHEYWAGLLGAFTKTKYSIEMVQIGDTCEMRLETRK